VSLVSWLLSLLRSALALRKAKQAGAAEQRAADQQQVVATDAKVQHAEIKADVAGPHTATDVDTRLSSGTF